METRNYLAIVLFLFLGGMVMAQGQISEPGTTKVPPRALKPKPVDETNKTPIRKSQTNEPKVIIGIERMPINPEDAEVLSSQVFRVKSQKPVDETQQLESKEKDFEADYFLQNRNRIRSKQQHSNELLKEPNQEKVHRKNYSKPKDEDKQ